MTLTETLRTCLGIKEGETVLLLSDTQMSDVTDMLENALKPLSREIVRIVIAPRKVHGEELPRVVSQAMAASDVVIGATSKSITHTKATKNAVKSGARVASMPGITVNMLLEGGMTADYKEVAKVSEKVANVLSLGKKIMIRTSVGTNFKADITGRRGYADTGLLIKKGVYGNLPGGEGFIAPKEGSSEGRIVFDGPIASSGLEHEPIVVDVLKGMAVDTNYDELDRIFSEIHLSANVAEIGIGTNNSARLIGNILEDEKALGTAHVAFGNNLNFGGKTDAKVHLDGIIKNPTILVDGEVIARSGELLL